MSDQKPSKRDEYWEQNKPILNSPEAKEIWDKVCLNRNNGEIPSIMEIGDQAATLYDTLGFQEQRFAIAHTLEKMYIGLPKNNSPLGFVNSLGIEWILEQFWGKFMRKAGHLMLEEAHRLLVKYEHTEKDLLGEPFDFNDDRDSVFYIPDDKFKVLCISTNYRERNYICFWCGDSSDPTIHIRRYYNDYQNHKVERSEDGEEDELDEYKNFLYAVTHVRDLQEWSDDVPGKSEWSHVYRPSLKTFKYNKFNQRFGDCRDDGYVATLKRGSVECALNNHQEIHYFFCLYLSSAITCLQEFYKEEENNA